MNSKTNLSKEGLQDTIEHLKAEARQILLPNKIWGAAAGLIPFGDWLIQKFYIKKDAIMKVGSLFKIDIKYIEEDIKRKKKIIEKYKKSKIETYRTSEIDENNLIKADYNKLNKESYSYQVKMTIKNTTQASAYVNGAIDIASIASSNINNVKAAWDNVQKFEMLYSIGDSVNSFNSWPSFPTEKLLFKYMDLIENAAALEEVGGNISKLSSTASVASKAIGIGSIIIGVAAGGYFTHQFCEEKINQFVEYYKENANNIQCSYDKAISYFDIPKDAQFTKICNSTESLKNPEKTQFSFDKLFLRNIFFAVILLLISFFIYRHFIINYFY
jgi:hypothetical protein